MTRRTFQPASGPLKIEPPSPERLHTGSSVEAFDSMSAQSGDAAYAAQRHQRQNSSWTSGSHYNEIVSPYGGQQRGPCIAQPQFQAPKASPSLPSIRDFDRVTTYNPAYASTGSYAYGAPSGAYNGHDNYSIKTEMPYAIKTETPSYFHDYPYRYGQGYQQTTRPPPPQMECPRYTPSIYEYGGRLPYQSPYGGDYVPSPTGSHHPVSPTVSNGEGCIPNRRRRGNLPKHITEVLRNWFMAHLEHPYPTEDDKTQFHQLTGLTIAQVLPFPACG